MGQTTRRSMTPKTLHTHARRILIGCLTALAVSVAPASIAQATEYHHTSGTDITATGGRTCGHGLNGAPGGTPRIGIRTIYVESAISCNFGSSGVPANLQLSLYLYYEYGVVDPESLTVGYGSSR